MSNYITKEVLCQGLEDKKLNYFIATLGTGKTTATVAMVAEKLGRGEKVLILTPYIISKEEYTSNTLLNSYIEYSKSGNVPTRESKLQVTYLNTLLNGFLSNDIKPVIRSNKLNLQESINLFRSVLTDYFNSFDLIVMDEVDFFQTQSNIEEDRVALAIDDRNFTMEDTMTATMSLIADSTATSIAISANKFEYFKATAINSGSMLSGTELLPDAIRYINTGLKSNLNIKTLKIINIVGDKMNYTRLKGAVVRSIDPRAHSLVYSSTKWSGTLMQALKYKEASIIVRPENLHTEIIDNNIRFKHTHNYDNVTLVSKGHNLSDGSFFNNNLVAVNMSSSRAVSLTNTYNNSKVIVFIDADRITKRPNVSANSVQVMGRFRNSPTDIVVYVHDCEPQVIEDIIRGYDSALVESVTEIQHYNVADRSEYNAIPGVETLTEKGKRVGCAVGDAVGKSVGKAIGKAVTTTTKHKKESVAAFAKEYIVESFPSKSAAFTAYMLFVEQNNYEAHASRNTFLKTFLSQD